MMAINNKIIAGIDEKVRETPTHLKTPMEGR
jgi:hypothetical protein